MHAVKTLLVQARMAFFALKMMQHSARQSISAWTDITMVLLAPMCSLLFEVCTLYI